MKIKKHIGQVGDKVVEDYKAYTKMSQADNRKSITGKVVQLFPALKQT